MSVIQFTFTQQGSRHYATPSDGTAFYVGTEVPYQGLRGLSNLNVQDGPVYNPQDYEAAYGHWAWFLQPTAQCESQGSFHCLNTYDRAAFTFTFMQFAAHVPEGDFVHLLRTLLTLPEAADYFPYLQLRNGRIWYVRDQQANQLETAASTAALMSYLNSDPKAVDNQELICSARMVHWAQQSADHRGVQVSTANTLMKGNLKSYAARFRLDGYPDYICQVICDIFHQGRAKYQVVQDILTGSPDRQTAYNSLLNVGVTSYPERIKTLKAVHKQLIASGKFGMVYDATAQDFRQP